MFVVFDLDGTLSDAEHRQHYLKADEPDWEAFYAAAVDDAPLHHNIATYLALEKAGHHLEIWTGRSDKVEAETITWLGRRGIRNPVLRMRPHGDHSPDHILKPSWLKLYSRWPDLIFEDRATVVAAWRALGIPVCQVADGKF